MIAKLGKINNILKLICSKKKGPHIETAIDICRSLTHGLVQHRITVYGWTSKTNIRKLNAALNNCFRTATGLLRVTPLPSLRIESKSSDFCTLLHRRAVNMAARSKHYRSK